MTRPALFEHNRWLGDKRNQRVHDLDHAGASCDLEDLLESAQYTTFGPDLLAEARNRGYRAHSCAAEV